MYGKVFAKLFDSSLAVKGPWQALVLWPCLIALADKDGDVEKPAEIISRITLMPMEHVRVALDALSAPDPHSKSPAAEGRRIVPLRPDIDAGWHLVNYTEYAKINSGIARKERDRSRKAEERKLLKDNERKCGQSTKSPHTDTDTDIDTDTKKGSKKGVRPPSIRTPLPDPFVISEEVRVWARKGGYTQPDVHLETFILTVQKGGLKYVNWDAAFKTAIKNNWANVPISAHKKVAL